MIARVLQSMVEYYGQDRRIINHTLKVYGLARMIAIREGLDREKRWILECAAALHDIGIPESLRMFGSSKGKYQEIVGRKVGGELMASLGFSSEFIDRVCFLIGHHHSYNVDGGPALQILFEADFLVNLDEGNASEETVMRTMERHFRTKTGKELLTTLFGLQPKLPSPYARLQPVSAE